MTIGFLGGKLCVEKCRADALQTSLCSPVAVVLQSNRSRLKALHGWQSESEATAGLLEPTPRWGILVIC